MCGRFTLNAPPELLAKTFNLQGLPQIEQRYNIAPSQRVPTIRYIGDNNKLDFLKWGLIPSWSKDLSHSSVNARSETVHEKPAFSHALKYNRCIIPSTGFYEWTEEGSRKQPYFIRLLNSGIIGLAGLWERWQGEGGDVLETCCILTTKANELMEPIHERMPVIIEPDDYDLWLNGNFHDVLELQRFYRPFPSDMMVAHKVPDLVNNPRFDSHACIVQV